MKMGSEIKKRVRLRSLFVAISAQVLMASGVAAAPTGGAVVGGVGNIGQTEGHTQITQDSNRLAIEWDTFDVDADESVRFIQPSANATALNRILDVDASQILGRIDANGRVILMNPNGLTFGEDSVVNVQSLIASGLEIATEDFMDGGLSFKGVDGAAGVVISSGIINAATGGNVALLGKRVENRGLISARLGRVALAAGNEAVLTFDDNGLLGVRIDEATLSGDTGDGAAVVNRGQVNAQGGKILLDASVSENLFSAAVNHGQLSDGVEAVIHSDGSFTLGGSNDVLNQGTLDVSTASGSTQNGGQVLLAGQRVRHEGDVRASTSTNGLAGDIRLQATEAVILGPDSELAAEAPSGDSGHVHLQAPIVRANADAKVNTAGNAVVVGSQHVRLPEVDSRHLLVETGGEIRQLGGMEVSGHTHLVSTSSKQILLPNTNNDFGSISVDSQGGAPVTIRDRNDIAVGQVELERGSMTLAALGDGAEIFQLPDSQIAVNRASLTLVADNVLLGEDGSSTRLAGGQLNIDFRESLYTNNSIEIVESTRSSSVQMFTFDGFGNEVLRLEGREEVDLDVQVERVNELELEIHIDRMLGENAVLAGYTRVSQSGPIILSDTLAWNGEYASLEHPDNDVRSITRGGALLPAFGSLTFYDQNDVELGNIDDAIGEDGIEIYAQGEIRQAPDTSVQVGSLLLDADRIYLGANGSSRVSSVYAIDLAFQSELWLDGDIASGMFGGTSIYGSEGDNLLVFGESLSDQQFDPWLFNALTVELYGGDDRAYVYGGNIDSVSPAPSPAEESRFDLGSGNDQLHLFDNLQVNTYLGDGQDVVTINRPDLNIDLVDFDPAVDVMIQTFP